MSFFELLLLAVSLSMDAFAASVCKGLATERVGAGEMCTVGLWFGGFQALMPIVGYLLGSGFAKSVSSIAAPLSFVLLTFIGANMILEAYAPTAEGQVQPRGLSPRQMLPLAVATSIDALAVGVMIAFLGVDLAWSASVIGGVTFLISAAGLKLGGMVGAKYRSAAEVCGGAVLVILGFKLLLGWLF